MTGFELFALIVLAIITGTVSSAAVLAMAIVITSWLEHRR